MFINNDKEKMIQQMRETLRIHGKQSGRQFYHVIVSFADSDRPENGGSLTAEKANAYASKYAAHLFQEHEVIWSCQDHGASIHIHFVVSACNQVSGRKINATDSVYRFWKDYAQTLALEFQLTPLDWREAVRQKRNCDRQTGTPVYESFAEKGRKAKGKGTYKDQLRRIIDQALAHSKTMDEFRAELEKSDVALTRCTSATISYKWGENRRPYRGGSLGDDYTAIAIFNRLEYNKKQTGFDAKIKSAELRAKGKRSLSAEEPDIMYDFGRTIGLGREEIGQLMDHALYASKKQKQTAWYVYKNATTLFWDNYRASQQEISNRLDELYRIRRRLKEAEYILNNSKTSMWGILYAFTLRLSSGSGLAQIEEEIRRYHEIRKKLHQDIAYFKTVSAKGIDAIKGSSFSTAEYMKVLAEMHDQADQALFDLLDIPPQHQYVLTSDYRMITKREYLQEKQQLLESERSLEYEL